MEHIILKLKLIGFSAAETTALASMCKLSQARLHISGNHSMVGYQIAENDAASEAANSILIVNANEPEAVARAQDILSVTNKIPTIFIGKTEIATTSDRQFALQGGSIGSLLKTLLGLLDRLAERYIVSKKTCLVVDDSALARTQMQIILSEHRRLDTEFAEDAEAAIMLTKSKTFDIIFLDVMMPGMDGYQACKLIKTEPLAKNTVVVMLTSKNSPFDRLHGASVGCNKYLTKPVTADQIQEVLQNYGII